MDTKGLIASWAKGRAAVAPGHVLALAPRPSQLADKFRTAYQWVVTDCIHTPYHDVEFGKPVRIREIEPCDDRQRKPNKRPPSRPDEDKRNRPKDNKRHFYRL